MLPARWYGVCSTPILPLMSSSQVEAARRLAGCTTVRYICSSKAARDHAATTSASEARVGLSRCLECLAAQRFTHRLTALSRPRLGQMGEETVRQIQSVDFEGQQATRAEEYNEQSVRAGRSTAKYAIRRIRLGHEANILDRESQTVQAWNGVDETFRSVIRRPNQRTKVDAFVEEVEAHQVLNATGDVVGDVKASYGYRLYLSTIGASDTELLSVMR